MGGRTGRDLKVTMIRSELYAGERSIDMKFVAFAVAVTGIAGRA
jgi:hypothetical protein